tara:strand:- start:8 stop:694 length:687 start_codon:yes stop_codon:yes gene_type:complete
MEGINESIIDELKEKTIERSDEIEITDNTIDEEDTTLDPPTEPLKEVKKSKKVRSEKQKAAFEKARIKRAENLKIKKQLEAEKKEQKKKEKELVKQQVKERLENPDYPVLPTEAIQSKSNPIHRGQVSRQEEDRYGFREQVVNNYYYYGHQPEEVEVEPPPRKVRRKKKPPPPEPEPESETESEVSEVSDVSEIDEPDTYRQLQNPEDEAYRQPIDEPEEQKFKFRFA